MVLKTVDAAFKLLAFTKYTSPEIVNESAMFSFEQFQELTRLLDSLETALRKDGYLPAVAFPRINLG